MKDRFRWYRRANEIYYAEDNGTGEQFSLRTKNEQDAARLLHARNESHRMPQLNLELACTGCISARLLVRGSGWR